jgi:ribosome maturation factor RimP
MRRVENELTSLVRSVVEPMGYELVGVEYLQRGKAGALLRVYIDHIDRLSQQAFGIMAKASPWTIAVRSAIS